MTTDFNFTTFKNVYGGPRETTTAHNIYNTLVPAKELLRSHKISKALKERKTEAYTLCTFLKNDSATQDNIKEITGISLDFDEGNSSFELVKEVLSELNIELLIHTTASHTTTTPRLRAVILYDNPLSGEEGFLLHKRVWNYFNQLVGPIDPAGKNPAQKWLFPTYGIEGECFLHEHVEGERRFNPKEDLEPETSITTETRSPSPFISKLDGEGAETELKELTHLLSHIDPSCSYPEWFEAIAASINAFGRKETVIELLDKWSQESPDRYDENAFYKTVESVRDDHKNPAGIGKLRYLAGVSSSQVASPQPKIAITELESIVDSRNHELAMKFTSSSHAYTMNLLRDHDNEPNDEQSKAIWAICEGMAYSVLAEEPIRVAYPLQTGLGKTSCFRGFARSMIDSGEDLSIAYCAERIEGLHDLQKELIEDGIPKDEIGLLHSSTNKHKEIPSIKRADADQYRILLLAHGRVQHELSKPKNYLFYKNKKRDLVVWDEAIRTSKGASLNVDKVRGDIASWVKMYKISIDDDKKPKPSSRPDYEYMLDYLGKAEEQLSNNSYGSTFSIPDFNFDAYDYKIPLRGVLGKNYSDILEQFIEFSGMKGRVITAGSNKAFIRFDIAVPDEVDKIVVLDASAEINLLNRYDSTIKLGDIGDIQKNYQNVTLHYAPVKSSRDYLSSQFKKEPEQNLYLNELESIVATSIPEGEDFLVFTYKDRNDIRYKKQILELMDSLGLGYRERCHVMTWGNERGSNRYAHVKYAITLGVVYRDPSEIASSIIGQSRDLEYPVSNEEIKEVSHSQQADILYQGLSRGNMRRTKNGYAGEMTCWVLHKEKRAFEMLEDEMSNVTVKPYIPDHLSKHGVSDAVADMASRIVDYLNSLPLEIEKISNQKIAKEIWCSKTNSRTWGDSVFKASNDQFEWEKPKGAQSFYRGSKLIEYKEQNKALTLHALADKTSLH